MLTSLKNSLSSYFSVNKPPRPPGKRPPSSQSVDKIARSRYVESDDDISSIIHHRPVQRSPDADSSSSCAVSTVGQQQQQQQQQQRHQQILSRTKEVRLVRDGGGDAGFGFTFRTNGGSESNLKAPAGRPFVITSIRHGSAAERDGTIQVGDRLMSVNGRDVTGCSPTQVLKWIRETDKLTLVIEYDVAVVDRSQFALGPLLVEVEKTPGAALGIHLASADANRCPVQRVVIESIAAGSIAERCGALQAGDQILAIGDVRLDGPGAADATQEAARLLRGSGDVVKLVVAPLQRRSGSELGSSRRMLPPPSPRPSHSGTLRSRTSGRSKASGGRVQRVDSVSTASVASSGSNKSAPCPLSSPSPARARVMLSHPEWVTVTLQIDCRGSYGLALGQSPEHDAPVVLSVESNSPCDRAGCIQPGDRILRINQQSASGLSLEEAVDTMRESKPRMTLDVEFDVADSVVPASGVYWLKLVKPNGSASSFGITLQDTKGQRGNEGALVVNTVFPGSVAHRTGSVQAGDRLLAINNSPEDALTLEDALNALQSEQVIRLKLQKGEPTFDEMHQEHEPVVFTVELVRHGGPLGITISGTENPNDPITISGLTEGGLAERTGALHVGDRLLAINGRSLQGKLLSEAIEILQNSGDVVTLKIGKATTKLINTGELQREDYLPMRLPPLPSIDSAVESWVSGGSNRPCSNNNSHDSPPIYTAESATVRRRQNHCRDQCWDMHSSPSVDSGQFEVQCNVIVNGPVPSPPPGQTAPAGVTVPAPNGQQGGGTEPNEPVIRMSDLALVQRCNTLPRNYRKIVQRADESNNSRSSPIYCLAPSFSGSHLPSNMQIHEVTLHKDSVYEDFGFSVSDGLYERGIYVNRIRKGGPADLSGLLQAYDRILQVNDTRTYDFDCCLTVPLIAAAGDTIKLVIGRNPLSVHMDLKDNVSGLNWEEEDDGIIPADADDCNTSSVFVGVRTITTTL